MPSDSLQEWRTARRAALDQLAAAHTSVAFGGHGKHIFRVDVPIDPFEPMVLSLPEDEITPVAPGSEPTPKLTKQQILGYLINGGLIAILRSNLSGGRNRPRAWLCLDTLENLTHTFVPERGVVGGDVVPFWATHDNKVFKAKRDLVVSCLEKSFGLSGAEAHEVVSRVGTTR